MLKVKICGITNTNDALEACKYGADALGFIFAESPRKITPKAAKKIIKNIPGFIAKVGVFVNADKDYVLQVIKQCGLNTLQLHGQESDKYCAFLQKYCKIIKAFRIKDKQSIRSIKNYVHVDAYLLDSYSEDVYGGTGRAFSYELIRNENFTKPWIIAGGINKKNIGKIANLILPFAFDVCSSIEARAGNKNLKKMQALIKKIKLM